MKRKQTLSLLTAITILSSGLSAQRADAQSVELTPAYGGLPNEMMPYNGLAQPDSLGSVEDNLSPVSLPENWIEYGSRWVVLENRADSEQGCLLILPQFDDIPFEQLPDYGYKFFCSNEAMTEGQISAEYEVSFSGSYLEFVTFIVSNVLPDSEYPDEYFASDAGEMQPELMQKDGTYLTSAMGGGLRYRFMRSLARLIGIDVQEAAEAAINAERQAAAAAFRAEQIAQSTTQNSTRLTVLSRRIAAEAAADAERNLLLLVENRNLRELLQRFVINRAQWTLSDGAQRQLAQLSASEQAAFLRALNSHYSAVGEGMVEVLRGANPWSISHIFNSARSTTLPRAVSLCDEQTGLFFRITGPIDERLGEVWGPITEILVR